MSGAQALSGIAVRKVHDMHKQLHRLAGAATALALALGSLVLPALSGSAAAAPDPSVVGLYGRTDPTYDGVYRQGLAILALHDVGVGPARPAVRWLLRQQCANGRFTSYRADLSSPCGAADSNATSMAVMALDAVGEHRAARAGARWLVDHQAVGGGWRYTAGWRPDANSTGLALQALLSVGIRPGSVSHGGTGLDFLRSLQLGCGSDAADRGALDYQAEAPLVANDYATAQAAQALARTALPVEPRTGETVLPVASCLPARAADAPRARRLAAGYLGRLLRDNGGLVPPAWGDSPDYGSTANAVLALVASGYGADQVTSATAALEAHARAYVTTAGATGHRQLVVSSASLLVLVEQATGGDPRDAGGIDLVARITGSIHR